MRHRYIRVVRIIGLLLVSMGLLSQGVQAQTDNWDYVADSPLIAPTPLLPVEFNGTGEHSFYIGNVGLDVLPFETDDRSSVTISLDFGEPLTGTDPVGALGSISGVVNAMGDNWFDFFNWEYLPGSNVFRGIQKDNTDLPGGSKSQVKVQYKVTQNSFNPGTFQNGFLAQWQPSAYTSNINVTTNDFTKRYTYVEAKDYGDAPTSGTAPNGTDTNNYGSAAATIDLSKDTNGFYNRYMYLGASVDPEDVHQASDNAAGDDDNQTGGLNVDDENGVTFPTMLPGATVIIPVSMTIVDEFETFPTGVLNAWIDWNGDGDWADAGEKIVGPTSIFGSGTVNLNVTVPVGAITNVYTYARFRFGNNANTTSTAPFGEVEDYQVFIGDPTAVTIGSVDLKAVSVKDFLNDIGADQMDTAALRDILRAWDSGLAVSAGADRDAIVAALREYLDPDGDGRVAVLHWDTLEERGTVGFYVKRSDANGGGETIINNDMLPGLINAPMGGEYMLADPVPTSGDVYQYRFIEQEATGNTREYGPYYVEMPQ